MNTNSGMPIPAEKRGHFVPLDGRRETHAAWMAGTIRKLDPFQDAVPCWHPDSFIHVTISYYNLD